ncbi:NAD(P)-dependent oxidoreductase [Streptomyces longwoodensis]|uniref:NAD-dependent epimerase/dehydratase family protein n=1 Tax=Streptomyces longwoodensis TaxID=68231 RepID=UPI0033FD040D
MNGEGIAGRGATSGEGPGSGGTVVITGATGFIGGAVLGALLRGGGTGDGGADGDGDDGSDRSGVPRVRALARRIPAEPRDAVEWVRGDVSDPASLRGLCEGATAVLHLASYVGSDEALGEAVNVAGTRAVMAEAARAGVPRVVHLSTAAVYGTGPHRGITVDEVPPEPVSAASRTRLAGERYAREAGAVVLRPGIVTGPGDRWVVTGLRELVERVPATWDGGGALLSVVDVGDLGRLVARLATGPRPVPSGVYHASHPEPVRIADLLGELAALGLLPPVRDEDWPYAACLEALRSTPGRASERQFALVARDHWYRSEEIWRLADCPPGPGPLARLAEALGWYRRSSGAVG